MGNGPPAGALIPPKSSVRKGHLCHTEVGEFPDYERGMHLAIRTISERGEHVGWGLRVGLGMHR